MRRRGRSFGSGRARVRLAVRRTHTEGERESKRTRVLALLDGRSPAEMVAPAGLRERLAGGMRRLLNAVSIRRR